MREALLGKGILMALLFVGLGTVTACGAAEGPPSKPAKPATAKVAVDPEVVHDVAFEARTKEEIEQDVELKPMRPARVVTVRRGEGVKFIARNLSAWVLIPDGKLKKGKGGSDWAFTDSYIAFKIDRGTATVVVPGDYPPSDGATEIWYSVMAYDGTRWDYIHGENPPPKMIIPP